MAGAPELLIVTALLLTWAGIFAQEDPFINPYEIDNTFSVDCGNVTDQRMRIVYRGVASSVYAANDPDACMATEVEPLNFEIADARAMTCNVMSDEDLEVYYLDLVVQIGALHQNNDPRHMVTCNYELSGTGQTGEQEADDSLVQRVPELQTVDNRTAESDVELLVYNAQGYLVETATLGTYIQLRAVFYPTGPEISFKVWNCKAYAASNDYYILMSGCGDGDVIPQNRGFFTMSYSNSEGATRIAKSYYFQSFSLPGSGTVQFWCDYVVCEDTSCDGASCENAPSRRRRGVTSVTLPAAGMPQGPIFNPQVEMNARAKDTRRMRNMRAVKYDNNYKGDEQASPSNQIDGTVKSEPGHSQDRIRRDQVPQQDVPDLNLPRVTSGRIRIVRPGEDDSTSVGENIAGTVRVGPDALIREQDHLPSGGRAEDGAGPIVPAPRSNIFDLYDHPELPDITYNDNDQGDDGGHNDLLQMGLMATMACIAATGIIIAAACLIMRRCPPTMNMSNMTYDRANVTGMSSDTRRTSLSPSTPSPSAFRRTRPKHLASSPAGLGRRESGLGSMSEETSFSWPLCATPSITPPAPASQASSPPPYSDRGLDEPGDDTTLLRSESMRLMKPIHIPRVRYDRNWNYQTTPSQDQSSVDV